MGKSLRIISLMVIWNLPTTSQKEKIISTGTKLSVGITSIILLEYIFRYIKIGRNNRTLFLINLVVKYYGDGVFMKFKTHREGF